MAIAQSPMNRHVLYCIIGFFSIVSIFVFSNSHKNPIVVEQVLCRLSNQQTPIMSVWNPLQNNSDKAIAILFNEEVHNLVPKIEVLDTLLGDNMSAHVIIFHTGYPYREHVGAVVRATKRHLIFYNIDHIYTSFPSGFDPYMTDPTWAKRGKWNYHFMCRFWFKLIMDIPLVQRYRFLMRLDGDSKITGTWFNVFDFMDSKKAFYFANVELADTEDILPGLMRLRNLTIEYKEKYKIIPKDPAKFERAFDIPRHIRLYNTNFDVIRVDFFNKSEVRHWVEAVDESYGIFKYRWGDHILRYITTALFMNPNEVLLRTDYNLPYCHPC